MRKTFKEIKEEIDREYYNKINDLKQSYIKYAKFSKNDIIVYNGVKYDLAYKDDYGHTIGIGVIKNVLIKDDEIFYSVCLLNNNPEKSKVEMGNSSCSVKESNIITAIGKVPMDYEKFVNYFTYR